MKAVMSVLCFNRPDLAASMVAQLGSEVVLVDNGSQPPLDFPVKIIRYEENFFFAPNWNRAMKQFARMGVDYVWQMNSDIEGVSQAMFTSLLQIVSGLGEECAALSPAFNSPHPHMQMQNGNRARRVRWLDWCAPLVSVKWWNRIGGFDERFAGYGADLDICLRLHKLGATFYVTDTLTFHHLGSQTALSEGLQGVQGSVTEMNKIFKQKYGIDDWTSIFQVWDL